MFQWIEDLKKTLTGIIKGKDEVVKMAIVCLVSEGHLLIEDVPGVGKTTLALSLARATDCTFQRIQFTSDLLPSDIIGVNIYNPEKREFEFRRGPVFANIVLADEINRTNPKTQSALLEAMNEKKVSVERSTYPLPSPFMVIATQNPLEYHGTFPLPESQLDRFMMHLRIGYPDYDDEKLILKDMKGLDVIDSIRPVVTKEEIIETQKRVNTVHVDDALYDYLLRIVDTTRKHEGIRLGVSTRGAQFLLRASKGHAIVDGRDYLIPDDIKAVAPLVIGHRIILKSRTYIRDAVELVRVIIDAIPVPL
ncbi:MAG: MoxR family ATPase [Nitrospirae bacterium]|nr:MoxR family ATPase [Nitrospirota bacterium]